MGYRADMSGVASKLERICKNPTVGNYAASEVERLSKQYVPYRASGLVTSVVVTPFKVRYTAPYAKYQWYGVSKNGNKFKNYTTPGTCSKWTDKLNKDDLARSVTGFIRSLG